MTLYSQLLYVTFCQQVLYWIFFKQRFRQPTHHHDLDDKETEECNADQKVQWTALNATNDTQYKRNLQQTNLKIVGPMWF